VRYITNEFDHWSELDNLLTKHQPDQWTVLRMPSAGLTGGPGLVTLEFDVNSLMDMPGVDDRRDDSGKDLLV